MTMIQKKKMEIKASQVKELREKSGVAMMDCKKALVESDGDIEKALNLLRSNSALKAEKKSVRTAADGIITTHLGHDYASLIEINSETDFAAKDSKFLAFVDEVNLLISKQKYNDIGAINNSGIEDKRNDLVQSIGENVQLRRIITVEFSATENCGIYLHSDSKLASVVVLSGGDKDLAKSIAMHVAAFNPLCLSEDDIDKDLLKREKNIFETQAKESGKPREIMEKIVEGKIKRFLSEVSLLSQDFVKDPEISVGKLLEKNNATATKFFRLKVGEGVEIQSKTFAEEVAEQLK